MKLHGGDADSDGEYHSDDELLEDIAVYQATAAIEKAAQDFTTCSNEGVFDGCMGYRDRMLLRIKTPSTKETGNVRSFFSGHYCATGLNVQEASDYRNRFIFFSVAAPGGSSDSAS
ncbi:hypothetical protein PF010_g4323 [Phytophthora fragariae]|uniref:Uncharacterized protein n=1 Tax=Phytophthora fragariae TaxID=53985 RepID=A0A6A3MDQ1_9STRA|nr:hypothetical protein PF011_g1670 [Phytophthora fragariae]KAE9128923.1 hypothetical protein PF010_g4323 [Phytophthora fragariae]KAE9253529.1 hypothetical protein PF004_g1477 [Phytophthora fragariae]